MSLKKFGFITAFLVIMALGLLVLLTYSSRVDFKKAGTDSGFDSSWDSGGSSGGGSSSWNWGSSSSEYDSKDFEIVGGNNNGNSHYSGVKRSPGEVIGYILIALAIIFVPALIISAIIIIRSKRDNGPKVNPNKPFYPVGSVLSEDERRLLFDFGLSEDKVVSDAYITYVDIQKAWSHNNIDEARNLLGDELYNTYKGEIAVMKAKHQRNEMGNFFKVDGKVTKVIKDNNGLKLYVDLNVWCNDYLIDESNGEVIRGDKVRTNKYYYSLTFEIYDSDSITNCPNCNAKLGDGSSVTCEYCGSPIVRKSSNMIMVDKKMVYQE